jgi:hypothetical protein
LIDREGRRLDRIAALRREKAAFAVAEIAYFGRPILAPAFVEAGDFFE